MATAFSQCIGFHKLSRSMGPHACYPYYFSLVSLSLWMQTDN